MHAFAMREIPRNNWRSEADESIEKIRKGDVNVKYIYRIATSL
jgi:hypothetical protein